MPIPHIPLPVISGVYRVGFHYSYTSPQFAANVMHFKATSLSTASFSTALASAWTSGQLTPVDSGASIDYFDVTPLDGTSVTVRTVVSGAKWAGAGTSGGIPQVACIVKVLTSVRGRDNRGRVYLPFISDTAEVNGFLNTGIQATTQTAWSSFFSALAAASITPGVASYDRIHSGAGAHFTAATSFYVENALATQRRRQQRLR